MREQRCWFRFPVALPTRLNAEEPGSARGAGPAGCVLDISLGGAFVSCEHFAAEGRAVSLQIPQPHSRSGTPLQLPGTIKRRSAEGLAVAFAVLTGAARASLDQVLASHMHFDWRYPWWRERGSAAAGDPPSRLGRIVELRPLADFGCILTLNGREVYFHRLSVCGNQLEDLHIGDQVVFVERSEDLGLHASRVRAVGLAREA